MKKNGLFKAMIITILAVFLLTWFIPYGYYSGEFTAYEISRLGFFDFCQYLLLPYFQSMFIQVLIFILSVGALYGVLSKTGKYRSIIENLAKKLKKKGTLFLVLTAFVFAALSSFGGYGLLLFLFIPAVIAIILELGYDKFTAFLTTFGAMLIGVIGATFGNSYLETIWTTLGATWKSQIWFKVGMFVFAFALLVLFTLKHINGKKDKKRKQANKKNDKKEAVVKEEKTEDIFLGETKQVKRSPVFMYVVFGILFVLLILGCTSWNSVFGIKVFDNFHTSVTEVKIGEFAIFKSILGSITALGTWSYFEMSIMALIAAFVLGKIYKLTFSEILEGLAEGAKKILSTALLTTFAYAVLIIVANTGVYTTLMSYLIDGAKKFGFVGGLLSSIITVIGSFLHVELSYVGNFFLPYLAGVYSSTSAIATLNVLSQGLYGVTMFIAPTSLFLILGLNYLDIPYKKWIKFIWKLAVALLVIVIIAIVLVALI